MVELPPVQSGRWCTEANRATHQETGSDALRPRKQGTKEMQGVHGDGGVLDLGSQEGEGEDSLCLSFLVPMAGAV